LYIIVQNTKTCVVGVLMTQNRMCN